MKIVNENNPFLPPFDKQVTLLKKFRDVAKDPTTRTTIEGFMWLKVNLESIKRYFETFHQNRNETPDEVLALGSGTGMPFHLGNYDSLSACETSVTRLVNEVEQSIKWAEENNCLDKLLGTLTTGCCMESHSRSLLSFVEKKKGLKPRTLNDVMASLTQSLNPLASDEETLIHFSREIGIIIQAEKKESKEEQNIALTYEQIIKNIAMSSLIEEDPLKKIAEKHRAAFNTLFTFRTQFLADSNVHALHANSIESLIKTHNFTPLNIASITPYLTTEEIDFALLAFTAATQFDHVKSLLNEAKSVSGTHQDERTGETTLIKLLKRLSDANKNDMVPLIENLLRKGADLGPRDMDGFSALSHALWAEANMTDTKDISRLLITHSKTPAVLKGISLREMVTDTAQWRRPILNLLNAEGDIALQKINQVSAFRYIIIDAGIVNAYLAKLNTTYALYDAFIHAINLQEYVFADQIAESIFIIESTPLPLPETERNTFLKDYANAMLELAGIKRDTERYNEWRTCINHARSAFLEITNPSADDKLAFDIDTHLRNLSLHYKTEAEKSSGDLFIFNLGSAVNLRLQIISKQASDHDFITHSYRAFIKLLLTHVEQFMNQKKYVFANLLLEQCLAVNQQLPGDKIDIILDRAKFYHLKANIKKAYGLEFANQRENTRADRAFKESLDLLDIAIKIIQGKNNNFCDTLHRERAVILAHKTLNDSKTTEKHIEYLQNIIHALGNISQKTTNDIKSLDMTYRKLSIYLKIQSNDLEDKSDSKDNDFMASAIDSLEKAINIRNKITHPAPEDNEFIFEERKTLSLILYNQAELLYKNKKFLAAEKAIDKALACSQKLVASDKSDTDIIVDQNKFSHLKDEIKLAMGRRSRTPSPVAQLSILGKRKQPTESKETKDEKEETQRPSKKAKSVGSPLQLI